MIPFIDVVKNFGDFRYATRESSSPRPMLEAPLRGSFENLPAYRDSSMDEPGFGRPWTRAQVDVARRRMHEARLMEARGIIARAFTGSRRDLLNFHEALSISDFPNLFGDVIDRAVLANYLETPYTWNMIAHQAEVSDFRPVKRFRVDGGTGLLNTLDANGNMIPLTQGAQYPEDSLTDAEYTYRLSKYGKRMPFFWETFINDDLNALKDTPARFGRGARRSEEYFVTKMFANNVAGTLGPNGYYFYSNGNKNIVNNTNVGDTAGNNPALTITALQRALIVMMQQVDTTGQPISVEAVTLVVPPSLKTVAMNILNTDYVFMSDQGGTQTQGATTPMIAQMLHAMNWAKNIVRLAVNYYLPIVDTTYGHTGWYLFANPESGRPALEFGKLRGHLTPELYMKLPNSVAIGEGTMGPGPGSIPGTTSMNPLEGDFDTDSVHYKIRHVFGGVVIDPIMTTFSNGSGT